MRPYSLYQEIFEQPDRLQALIHNQRQAACAIAEAIQARDIRYVFLTARGSSDNAGRYANYLWGAHNRYPIALATPSLFTYYKSPPSLRSALVVGVSQSGFSPDIISVLNEGREQGCLTLAITNAPDSPLTERADLVFDIQAGEEQAVAATKSYTAQLAAIAMLSVALAPDPARWAELEKVPRWVAQALEQDESIVHMAQRYRYMDQCVVLGRGFNYATAFEWALKLKELTYIIAEPYSSADFQHGPIAMVEGGFPVLAVAPRGQVFPSMSGMLTTLREGHQVELVVISDDELILGLAQSPIPLTSGIPEWLTPIVNIVLAQLFTCHLALAKGYDPDQPRGLNKITRTH
ncbi:MAG: SIS domain-containing protein [Chloroflexi bacterium]|nr:SIS domain-containing protein [Chloroflexota bacterium]